MQPYMLEEFPPEISRLQPLFFSSDFGDQSKYLLSLYRSFYLCLGIAHDIIPLRPDLPYPVHDELPALSPKKYNITFLKLSVRLFEIYHMATNECLCWILSSFCMSFSNILWSYLFLCISYISFIILIAYIVSAIRMQVSPSNSLCSICLFLHLCTILQRIP